MAIGIAPKPIYRQSMPATCWQLLWWLICEMDGENLVRGGWRTRAAKAMKKDRIWVGRAAEILREKRLIYMRPYARGVLVEVRNITA